MANHYLSSAARHPTMSSQKWKAIHLLKKRAKPPSKPPSIREAVRMLGAVGRHMGRKGDEQTPWQGVPTKRILKLESF